MGRRDRRHAKGRARWLVAFTLLLLATGSVPVLADPPASESDPAGSAEPSPLPDGDDLLEATKQVEEKEEERALELESPAAVAAREESELAYKDLESAGAVSDLLRSTFGEELEALDLDPARYLSDATLKRNLQNDGGAVVTSEAKTELLDAEIPAEVRDEDGELSKVDLSLEGTAEGFEPENPVIDLLIPASPADGVSIGVGGETSITQVGANPESSAHLFGDKDVIYPEVQTDTDLLASPLSTGVELFDQLRSIKSPETLRFDLDLPEGSELRANAGAAEVYEGERLRAIISPPHAIDAQGTRVPVTMDVQGSSLVLDIPHREGDYAYPILVDPEYTQNDWVNNAWIFYNRYDVLEDGTFVTSWNNANLKTSRWCIYSCWGSGRGLFVSVPSGNYGAQQWAQWTYRTPGETSYLTGYLISPFYRYDFSSPCWADKHPEPHDYDGLWVETSPGQGYYNYLYTNRALYSNASIYNAYGTLMVFGMNTGSGSSDPCWRDLYAGGIATYMTDPDWPTLDPISGYPTGWFDDTKTYGVNVSAHDKGLGVANVRVNVLDKPAIPLYPSDCLGTHDYPCSRDKGGTIVFNGDNFREGKSEAKVVASDALQRASNIYPWTAYVDSTPPEVKLSGELAVVTEEEKGDGADPKKWDKLSLPVYNLKVEAEDGSKEKDSTLRSGVKNIEIFLDKKATPETVPWLAQTCSGPYYSCKMAQTYALKVGALTPGKHTLKVFAVDQLGHKRERDIEFEFIPATGMKDEYVMQYFPLPDGQGNEAEEEHPSRPELAVNVMSGNLVFRQKDVDVEGYGADLEVERFYNSQLPDYENTEWGDGWTLAQTPELDPEEGVAPKEAELVDTSGGFEGGVDLPTEAGKAQFDPALQVTLTKEVGGGYELADETGETETAIAFDASGRTEELRTEGYAKVDYDYDEGKLAKIAVEDPASVGELSEAEEEALEYVPPAPSYKSTFGALGSGDGQLKAPGDVAIAANGDLFVVDRGNNRIERFNQEGKFVSKFGSEGSDNGQFKRPCAIAIDSSGNLWVADADNNRIQKFTATGTFVKAVGVAGNGNAQFNKPEGIATDLKGNVYVADTFNSRIQILNSAGEFVSKVGSLGTAEGQFNQPVGVDIGPGGKLWVADRGLHRISEFDAAGTLLRVFGSQGSGDGQFWCPEAMEVDSRGNVFVGDRANNRIQQFSSKGKYLTKFGSQGTGAGQFNLQFPMGVAVDNLGGLWVSDVGNHRIQKWSVPNYRPYWFGAFGIVGAGDGQLKAPADIAFAANGDLFIVDKGNNRIERFDREGKFISKFGSYGSSPGLFSMPTSIAVDGSSKLWITDKVNNRVQVFTEAGTFVKAIGGTVSGTEAGKFNAPEGIATDGEGHVYVADTLNKRIQVFDEEGNFLTKFGSAGSGTGQFSEANAIDVGRDGGIYVADWVANRVQKFNEKYEYVLQFGSSGPGDGQFSHPDAVEADGKGNVFVGDQSNGRVQIFNEAGEYVTQFDAKGSGEAQFSFTYPMGIIADSSNGVWITDVSNNRIQKWLIPSSEAPKVPEENDPSVDIDLEAGVVSSVEGEEAGVNTYGHTGTLLTSYGGSQGETSYVYDAAGRMTKVTLPNGTWGSIAYEPTYGRVTKVTVDPAGSEPAKTTFFSYSEAPRRTTVTPEGAPTVVYDIGPDGSVLKWQNVKKPPIFDNIYGSLYFYKETAAPIPTGAHVLDIQAHADEGIASIQVIVNGSQLVDEKTCTENLETPEVECQTVKDEWVMETENYAPGILNLEVIAKDRLGEMAAQRFWVNIPLPPPPPPDGAPARPKFSEVERFREEFGLDIVDPVDDEMERNGRIFNLINAWTEGEPVARASAERWGVPLRPRDVAEMEYRERYVASSGTTIPDWAASHGAATYAGYYVDHRAGGLIRVGFTSGEAAKVAELKAIPGIEAADRLSGFGTTPAHPLAELESLQVAIGVAGASAPLRGLITRVGIDVKSNVVSVGATNVGQSETQLRSMYGLTAPFTVYQDPNPPQAQSGHWTDEGPLRGGHAIGWYNAEQETHWCTAGFGAWEKLERKPNNEARVAHFALTAGHCFGVGVAVHRFHDKKDKTPAEIGTVTRRSIGHQLDEFETDIEAVRLRDESFLVPRTVFQGGRRPAPIKGVGVAKEGTPVCISGATTEKLLCGSILGPAEVVPFYPNMADVGPFYQVPTSLETEDGDSGSPIFNPKTGEAIGLHVFGGGDKSCFTPLLHPPQNPEGFYPWLIVKSAQAPGALHAPDMGSLHIETAP